MPSEKVVRLPETEEPERANAALTWIAAAALAVSLVGPLITGSIVFGRTDETLRSLAQAQQRDHDETAKHLDALAAIVNSLSAGQSAQAQQIEALRNFMQQERSDRLESERRLLERRG